MSEAVYTCPYCGRVSHNPNDLANRYCGACHRFAEKVHCTQYRPAFFEGFENEEDDVETVAELLELGYIKRWRDGKASPGFSRFSISHPYPHSPHERYHHLMAEIDNNREWWIVAILDGEPDHPIFKEMPEWHSPS